MLNDPDSAPNYFFTVPWQCPNCPALLSLAYPHNIERHQGKCKGVNRDFAPGRYCCECGEPMADKHELIRHLLKVKHAGPLKRSAFISKQTVDHYYLLVKTKDEVNRFIC